MRGRSFLILLVVALGLGAYIYFVESERTPSSDVVVAKDKVFTIDDATLEEIEVKAATGEVTALRKVNGLWTIVRPEELKADTSEVGSLISSLETLEIQRVVSDNPPNAGEFGLEPARISVGIKKAGEATPARLQLGRKTPTGSDVYARLEGQPRVFLISGFVEDSLNKTTFGLQDKTALQFERDVVDAISVDATGSQALAFAKKGDDWRFTRPYDAKADAATIDGMIGRVATARMTSIEAKDGTADLKKYGLDKPQATVTIGSGSSAARLAFGAKKDDTNLYARDLSRPLVFTVEPALLEEFKKKPEDLRRKDVFEFRSFSAVGAALTVGGVVYEFEKQKGAKPADPNAPVPDVWKLIKPAAKDVDQTKLADLLTTLSSLRAESFTEKVMTSGDDVVVRVKFGDDPATAKTEEIRFRKSATAVHAILPGEGGAAVVSLSEFDRALALVKELAGVK